MSAISKELASLRSQLASAQSLADSQAKALERLFDERDSLRKSIEQATTNVSIEAIALTLGNVDRSMWGLPSLNKIEGPHWENSLTKARAVRELFLAARAHKPAPEE